MFMSDFTKISFSSTSTCLRTGWHIRLCFLWRTFRWLQNKSSILARPGQARPKWNFCFEVRGRFATTWCVTLYCNPYLECETKNANISPSSKQVGNFKDGKLESCQPRERDIYHFTSSTATFWWRLRFIVTNHYNITLMSFHIGISVHDNHVVGYSSQEVSYSASLLTQILVERPHFLFMFCCCPRLSASRVVWPVRTQIDNT